jgi:hypothetical protein
MSTRVISVRYYTNVLIIYLFIIINITFMRGIYNYIPETNHFSTVCNGFSYSVVKVYGTLNAIFHAQRFVLLH